MRPGTWPFTPSLSPSSIWTSRKNSSTYCWANSSCIPPVRFRPMSGISATSTRPCMPGQPSFYTGRSRLCIGRGDTDFLKRSFGKLMLNFSWWINRKDRFGKNLFEGGFLGLDNISVFDRSAALPTGGHLEQADGTSWVALFAQNLLEIAAGAGRYRSYLRGHGSEVNGPYALDRPRHESSWPGWHVGRRGWVLLRRPAPSRRHGDAAEGPVDGGTVTRVCHLGNRAMAAGTDASLATDLG